jgi:ArsR family transcriptional regulator, arsenate/arsenite/antimonite-responsive transcriptional repressor
MTDDLLERPNLIEIGSADSELEVCCLPDTGSGECCGGVVGFGLQLGEVDADRLATIFKALGHPVRLQIVELLSRFGGQVCVCDIETQFDLSQPTISHHLKVLRQAQVVDSEQRGLWVHYFLRADTLTALKGLIEGVTARAGSV